MVMAFKSLYNFIDIKQSAQCNKHIYPSNKFGPVEQCQTDRAGSVCVCDLSYVINISLDFCSDSKHITLAHAAAFQCICMALISTVWAQLLEQSPAAKTHTLNSLSLNLVLLLFLFFYNTNTHTHTMPCHYCTAGCCIMPKHTQQWAKDLFKHC